MNLDSIISPAKSRFSARFSHALLDDLMYRGDAPADEATVALHEEKYDPDGSQLRNLRKLARDGEPRAKAFFLRAEQRPEWLDDELLARGQSVALECSHHYGMSLMHSLFAGAIFARATLVTASTGRLGSNPGRRIQETGSFIGALLTPGGLEPGALGFETAVRVRLLHGSIRSWIKRSPGFQESYLGEPIDQTMLAMTLGLFDYLNLRSMSRMGISLSANDIAAHHHLWRYVGYLIGIDEVLLTESVEEERELWSALVAHQAFPELFGPSYLDLAVKTVGGLSGAGSAHQAFIRNLFLHLSGGEWFGTEENVFPDPVVTAFRAGSFTLGTARQWVPGVSWMLGAYGTQQLKAARSLAAKHKFGVELEVEDEAPNEELQVEVLAEGVRARLAQPARTARADLR